MTAPAFHPGQTGTDEVLFATDGYLGRILLNRPKALNSLTPAMCAAITAQLERWSADASIKMVAIQGAGDRGLCAGADVKAIRDEIFADPDGPGPMDFFRAEYAMNQLIDEYPKPYLAVMDGICMGGGLGISAHGGVRLVTERSELAMPETIIGLFPDVGLCHLLARTPGEFGTHLALTGTSIGAGDALAAGLADDYLTSDRIEAYLSSTAIGGVVEKLPARPEPALLGAAWIDECYSAGTAAEILERLRHHDDPAAQEAAAAMAARSPFSVCVTLEAIRRAATLSVPEVLLQDAVLVRHFIGHPDFLEGVRCQLVDKGETPAWQHASLDEVPRLDVLRAFDEA